MATIEQTPKAFGAPGIPPQWTRGAKEAVGTAYSTSSQVWFTVSGGILNEIYYPTIDRPQVRDLQYLVTDGKTFFHDIRRHLISTVEYVNDCGLGIRIVNEDPDRRYRLINDVIGDPHQPCVLIETRLDGDPDFLSRLRLYVLLAPHLEVGGWGNTGNVTKIAGHSFLSAHKKDTWLALGADVPFLRSSCGYAGTSDGWQEAAHTFKVEHEFAAAEDGNVALCAELDLRRRRKFTLGLAFGHSLHRAVTNLFQSLGIPFCEHRARLIDQWERACSRFPAPTPKLMSDGGALHHRSRELLLAHEDKSYPGGIIASMSIPWGEVKGDEDLGGYHLVWTRDMVNSATGLLAAGDVTTPLRALTYLACSQQPDGGFPQNFWIDGRPYWSGIQLDEVAFPIILAWRLSRANALREFDPYPMVLRAARYLAMHGPATPQERWEENSGYSPSTLASNITALACAAHLAYEHGDPATSQFLLDYADFLESHIERWSVTRQGFLVPGIKRHYIRINPADCSDPACNEDPDKKMVPIRNRPPGAPYLFPVAEIVDAGFLELVRYGIRRPGDPLIEDSLRVVDAVLKTEFPAGPCWKRYTHDGYGQRDDGRAYVGWGIGRPWPLLTGERGHYELAAGRDVTPFLRAMENFATRTRLLPEQIWDRPDVPPQLMFYGKPTGAAMPLMWAHAEYLKLVRSTAEGVVFDLVPEVAERYRERKRRPPIEVWKSNRRVPSVMPPCKLRIQQPEPFILHWSKDEWRHAQDSHSTSTAVGLNFVDIDVNTADLAPVRFTFHWEASGKWEGSDYAVELCQG